MPRIQVHYRAYRVACCVELNMARRGAWNSFHGNSWACDCTTACTCRASASNFGFEGGERVCVACYHTEVIAFRASSILHWECVLETGVREAECVCLHLLVQRKEVGV